VSNAVSVIGRKRTTAGKSYKEALSVAKDMAEHGWRAVISCTDTAGDTVERIAIQNQFVGILDEIGRAAMNASVSVRVSQFGRIDWETTLTAMDRVAYIAEENESWMYAELDPEEPISDFEHINVVSRVRCKVGITLLASSLSAEFMLRKHILGLGCPIRLCGKFRKGDGVFDGRRESDENFLRLANILLAKGGQYSFSGDDPELIRTLCRQIGRDNAPSHEIVVPFTSDRGFRRELEDSGFPVSVEVPYGKMPN